MGHALRWAIAMALLAWLTVYLWLAVTAVSAKDLPILHTGDIIFQTSRSSQSTAIPLASHSLYTHMGLIELGADGAANVVEAAGPVRSTPLDAWIKRGIGGRVTIKRMQSLSEETARAVLTAAHRYDGLPYDIYFLPDKDHICCSELVHLAFAEGANIEVGKMQRVSELDIDNFAARNLMKRRWKSDPLCQTADTQSFESCFVKIMNQQLITPVAIAHDKNLSLIFSNYGPLMRNP